MPQRNDRPGWQVSLLSIGAFLLLWALVAFIAQSPQTLPTPLTVARLTISELASGELLHHLGATLLRTIAAFIIAMTIGAAIGLVMGTRSRVNAWGDPWLIGLLNLPALVTIALCYIWIGLTEVAAIAAVAINKIPLVATQMREGARALDRSLNDMAHVFGLTGIKKLRHVVLPQLAPYFAASGRTGLSLIWKIVLVVEFLGRSNGVGFQIHQYFQLFDVGRVLVYAISFIIVMLLVETLFLQPWERRATRWRRPDAR